METETKDSVQSAAPETIQCPCCGQSTLRKPVQPPSVIMDQYMSCMITGVPFAHTYPLYGGRVNVTATQIDSKHTDTVQLGVAAAEMLRDVELSETCKVNVDRFLNLLKLYITIQRIEIADSGSSCKAYAPAAEALSVLQRLASMRKSIAASQRTEEMPAPLPETEISELYSRVLDPSLMSPVEPRILLTVAAAHSNIYDILMEAGFDENFWKGIELV